MNAMAAKRHRSQLDPDRVFPTQCKRTNKAGAPCGVPPVIGSALCYRHGGSLPNVRKAADARVTQAAAERTLKSMLLNLDADPIRDPVDALMRLAGRLESGFVETAKRINATITAGGVPSETDVALLRILGREARTIVTDMTRLQIGVAAMAQYAATDRGDDAVETAEVVGELSGPVPDVADIVARVLETEHHLETERLVKVEQAKQLGAAPLRVVDGQAESA